MPSRTPHDDAGATWPLELAPITKQLPGSVMRRTTLGTASQTAAKHDAALQQQVLMECVPGGWGSCA